MARVHHTAICCRDVDASLRFWCDGLGFERIMDLPFDGDWPTLFGASSSKLRSLFLGDPADLGAGIIELVVFGEADGAVARADERAAPRAGSPGGSGAPPNSGFFLVSVSADVEATLARLDRLGVGGRPRRIVVSGVQLAVVTDPDGVLVELMDDTARSHIDSMTDAG